MRNLWALFAAIFLLASSALAQKSVTPNPQNVDQSNNEPDSSFEVASVRLSPRVDGVAGFTSITPFPANQFIARHATLRFLTAIAYGVDSNRAMGGPAWFDSQQYDVSAKVEGDAELTREQMQPLLQHLLQNRLHLKTHRETKILPGYILVAAKGGPKLKPSKEPAKPFAQIVSNGMQARGITISGVAGMLASPVGRPVIDKTGLGGTYDFNLDYARLDDPNPTLPSVFTALQEQLGLKLVPQRVPVEILVIDSVDRVPTEN